MAATTPLKEAWQPHPCIGPPRHSLHRPSDRMPFMLAPPFGVSGSYASSQMFCCGLGHIHKSAHEVQGDCLLSRDRTLHSICMTEQFLEEGFEVNPGVYESMRILPH